MKLQHLILAGGIALFASCDSPSNIQSDYATTNASTTIVVPATTQTAFVTRYPTATNVEWLMYNDVAVPIEWDLTDWPVLDNNDYVVRYNIDNTPYYTWYDSDGNWIGTTNVVNDFTTLPMAVQTTLSTKYAGYTISEVHAENWKNIMGYEIEMKRDNEKVKLIVDTNGNILKEKVKTK
jgi:hypothetical protein